LGTKFSALAHRGREIYCAEIFANAKIGRQKPRATTRASRMRGASWKPCTHRSRIPDRMWQHLCQSCY